jgi:hypothetical protein
VSHFEYISVLFSIVIAFGISEIVSGWGRLLRARSHVRFYWIHAAWSLLLLLMMVQYWWGFWQYRVVESWSFGQVVITFSEFLTLVFVAFLITPEVGEGELDLRSFYYDNHGWIFALAALVLVQIMVGDKVVGMQPFLHVENLIRGTGVALMLWLARSRSERLHGAASVAAFALFAVFVATVFQRD